MHRLSAAIVAALVATTAFLAGLQWIAHADDAPTSAGVDSQDEGTFQIFMSDVENGVMRRNFLSDTNEVYAVVEYEDAVGEEFVIELRDLSGVRVKREEIGPLTGPGKVSVPISVLDFVRTYTSSLGSLLVDTDQGDSLPETVGTVVRNCANRPEVPNPWPPPVPTAVPGQPTPTPQPPGPYDQWLIATLDPIDSSLLIMAEVSRTMQSMLSLPDMAEGRDGEASAAALRQAQQEIIAANDFMAQVPSLLRPPDGTTQPDPETGCGLVDQASAQVDAAIASFGAAMVALPEDVSGWGLVPTSARYDDGQFVACLQYSTDLTAIVGGAQGDTAAASAIWTLGDPGAPALVFPAQNQTDPVSLGLLSREFPGDATAIYAKSVQLDVNHMARIGAYVTDQACLPVDGVSLDLSVEPSAAGSLSASVAPVVDGVASVDFEAGQDVPESERGNVTIRGEVGSGPDAIGGETRFGIIGRAENFRIIVNPKTLNPLRGDRGGITVEVKDVNGSSVADGTAVELSVREGSPGYLAYEVRRAGSNESELVVTGKSIDLVTVGGRTIRQPQPGAGERVIGVFLVPGEDGDGEVTLVAEADGNSGNSDDPVSNQPTLFIQSRADIYLPFGLKSDL